MATRTAAERRAEAHAAHRAAATDCPTNRLLDRLGDKWAPLLLRVLASGPHRYNALSRTVAGASQKMLTQTLRSLERDGLVTRTPLAGDPPHVEYSLTPLARTLLPVLDTITTWADTHMPHMEKARTTYDTTHPTP